LLDICWNILTMHGPINVKSGNNTSKWQMGFSSAFKWLSTAVLIRILESNERNNTLKFILQKFYFSYGQILCLYYETTGSNVTLQLNGQHCCVRFRW
jgi:hypothetical protein